MRFRLSPLALAPIGLLLLMLSNSPSTAQPCCGPITPNGLRLVGILDATGVDHLWISGHHVDWSTGETDQARPDGREAATHCSAFAAAVAARFGIYVLRPPEHPQQLLASAQMLWLHDAGSSQGWQTLPSYLEAQKAANRGELVLEAYENPNPHRPGHIAIVRPSNKTLAELNSEGPQETQAGAVNAISTTTAAGFSHHQGAWAPDGAGTMGYYAHPIDWDAVK